MKKKVYTITFHLANNYGALLQTYALQQILLKKYETKVLNYDNYAISNIYRIVKKGTLNIFRIAGGILKRIPTMNLEIKRIKNFNKFRKKILLTKPFDDINQIPINNIDCIITGSDQVWNPKLTKKMDKTYFLDFSYTGKRMSYAASCGKNSNIDDEALCAIKNIDKISVREDSLNEFLMSKSINNVTTVLDPTLLLTKEEWKKEIKNERIILEKYIFAYSVGNETKEYISFLNEVSKKTNLKVIFFDKKQKDLIKNKKSYFSAGPEEFLNLLYNAEYVITTSFHGFALSSVLNKKMFVALSSAPDRLTSLAKKISLEDRIITNKRYNLSKLLEKEIDWNIVNKKLSKERQMSIDWLYNCIDEE